MVVEGSFTGLMIFFPLRTIAGYTDEGIIILIPLGEEFDGFGIDSEVAAVDC